jgi:hypothetical protein
VLFAHLIGDASHLLRIEMVDGDGDANSAKLGDQLGRFLDRFPTVALGVMRCLQVGSEVTAIVKATEVLLAS